MNPRPRLLPLKKRPYSRPNFAHFKRVKRRKQEINRKIESISIEEEEPYKQRLQHSRYPVLEMINEPQRHIHNKQPNKHWT